MQHHRSLMSHSFANIPDINGPRSVFNRSHGIKTTFRSGYAVPFFIDEVIPGDTHNLSMTGFVRMLTPLVPVMDNIYLDSFFFFVPMRLCWTNWERFCGAKDVGDNTVYVIPTLDLSGSKSSVFSANPLCIANRLGLPTESLVGTGGVSGISALPFRATYIAWRDWIRDQNFWDQVNSPINPGVPVLFGDGPDEPGLIASGAHGFPRCKMRDYFTSCLPWPQKGPAVTLPLGTSAPIVSDSAYNSGLAVISTAQSGALKSMIVSGSNVNMGNSTAPASQALYADLNSATAATVAVVRQAFQIQKFYEILARGGSRYVEFLRSVYNVVSPDFRLQRAEYLGGGTSRVNMNPVPQTSATSGGSPQGNLAAFGTCVAHGHGFRKSFTEHGYIIGFISVRADLTYEYGIDRMWTRSSLFDFYIPQFSHLSEQTVYNKELYAQLDSVVDGSGNIVNNMAFGYQARYDDYRYKNSINTALMKNSAGATSFSIWHLGDKYLSLPSLNYAWLSAAPPIQRCLAVTGTDEFLGDFYMDYKSVRPMPTYAVPGLIDHF